MNTRSQTGSPFNAPPFVTVEEFKEHRQDSNIGAGQ